jgi:hypothetical protein
MADQADHHLLAVQAVHMVVVLQMVAMAHKVQ